MRKHIVLICGGRSAEHEISLLSAASVLPNLNPAQFRKTVLGIAKDGSTMHPDQLRACLNLPASDGLAYPETKHWLSYLVELDPSETVVFPLLHGPYGEDGTVQGALEMLGLPYVGASVGGSAVGMNKIYCKRILQSSGLPVLPFLDFDHHQWQRSPDPVLSKILSDLELPVFVKPANMGSSVGISRVSLESDLPASLELAFRYDDRTLIEKGIDARDLEVSVLGLSEPRVSKAGEIIPCDSFYSYEAKYQKESELLIPAPLTEEQVETLESLASRAFLCLQLEGMARIDFLLDKHDGMIWISEPNTIPGFTKVSMYPKLWGASGLSYAQLLEELVLLGLSRHRRRSRLSVDR